MQKLEGSRDGGHGDYDEVPSVWDFGELRPIKDGIGLFALAFVAALLFATAMVNLAAQ